MDKMLIGFIDVFKFYLDYYFDVGKIDYCKSIFIFFSNIGGYLINNDVLNYWKEGKKREDIKIKQMDKVINFGEFNNKGSGFWYLVLIEKNFIDYFILFMSLERFYIKMCVKVDLEQKGYLVIELIFNNIVDEFMYFLDDLKVFFQFGCKKVFSKVDYIMG